VEDILHDENDPISELKLPGFTYLRPALQWLALASQVFPFDKLYISYAPNSSHMFADPRQLVASSTVGIAAAGLALGKPDRATPPRPTSKKRKAGDLTEVIVHNPGSSASNTRPGTSSTIITPESRPARPPTGSSPPNPTPTLRKQTSTARVDIHNNNNSGRRFSILRHDELSSREYLEEEPKRDSISSRGSWMRRLSIIPTSQGNSPRSSVGPDSPSINPFNGPALPILSNPGSSPAQLPPNKLVKRGSSIRQHSGPTPASRKGSKSEVPTLRRPATSHQRSVTLQQQFREEAMDPKDSLPQTSAGLAKSTPAKIFSTPDSHRAWRLYFDSRPTKLTKERSSGKSVDVGIHHLHSTSRRVMPDEAVRPTLIKPEMITKGATHSTTLYYDDSLELEDSMEEEMDTADEKALPSTETHEPQKRARRSLSMHFSSPSSWISRSGSLRGNKRNPDGRSGDKRHASAPVSSMSGRGIVSAHDPTSRKPRPIMDPSVFQAQQAQVSSPSDPFSTSFQARTRTSSSPLPPLSRLSSFNLDLARLGLSSSSSSAPRRSPNSTLPNTNTTATSVASTGHPSPSSTPYFLPGHGKTPRTSEVADRTSTLIGSDQDAKGFTSGEEDEMDYQSETVYDSLRSGATSSVRSHNPLESMFEESPPSLNGHVRSKRLSIHEMLNNGTFQEGSNRIIEEDEGMPTPVKVVRSSQDYNLRTPVRMDAVDTDELFPSSPPTFCLATKDFGRLSLDDDDEDEDWTRDDENMDISNSLSPPSSSLNSRKVSPSFRAALADVTHSASTNGKSGSIERPRSNLFDWSEPSTEKVDYMGNSPRPRTAHVKQVADIRGGRAIGRRGPSALHIRSQSVPVVPDVAGQREHSKLTPKFGTWGLGAKGVSEDWDNDFEFDNNSEDDANDGDSRMEISGMHVPLAIQASQASVVGHVGQIREVCLLVEDLKRLRLLGKEKGILDGPSAALWKEAEGIIALAVPDEEDLALSPPGSPSSISFDEDSTDDKYLEQGTDLEDISKPDAPIEVLNRRGQSTGLVYDGTHVRQRSVFSLEDDIFGAGLINTPPVRDHLRPPSTSPRHSSMKSASEVARSVMETMHQHRSTSDPLLQNMSHQSPNKMPFDTTSLRDLVQRASNLSRALSDLIRKADGRSQSPELGFNRESSPAFTRVFSDPGDNPEVSANLNSSPAFTRVFTDTMASSPKSLPRSHSNNSVPSGSVDISPSRRLGQRMQMMTVV
jgi:hypothetical protein